jgi:DNA polymerase IV
VKIMCVLLPHFPFKCELERRAGLRRHPAVLVRSNGSNNMVYDYSPQLKGFQRDMPLQQALSIHERATLIQADIPYYHSVFNEILNGLGSISPLVEGDESGCIYIGMDGLQMLYPDDISIIKAVRKVIPSVFESRIGIAQGKFPAYIAALSSKANGQQILTDNPGNFLKNLSCDLLPVSMKSKNKLKGFGLKTLGQIASLPPGPLLSQFGEEGRKFYKLAAGKDDEPVRPRLTEESIEAQTELNSVTVSLETLLSGYESILLHILSRITPEERGIRCLTLWTCTWSGEYRENNIRFKEPAVNIKTISAKIKLTLENNPQPGPVERLGIRITALGQIKGRQKSLLSNVRARENLLNDIQGLEQRLGSPQVFKIKEVESWSRIPERRCALIPLSR